jgi:hypothetical protein
MEMTKQKKKSKKIKKGMRTKIILVPDDDVASGDEDDGEMVLEKEDLKLIYNALSAYKPPEKEEHLHSVLLEEFEEILVVDYNEPFPDAN